MVKQVRKTKATIVQKTFMVFFVGIVLTMLTVILINDLGVTQVQNSEMYRHVFYSSITLIAGYLFGSNARTTF